MLKKNNLYLPIVATLLLVGALANYGAADLVFLYEFEGNFEDGSSNGIHGAPVGDAKIVFDAARNSNVLSLDGDDDVVRVDVDALFDSGYDLLEDITVAMWVNTSQDVGGIQFSGGLNTDWAEGGVHIKLNNGTMNVGINGGPGDVVGTTVIPVGEWHHIAFTASATEIAVYYDGVMEGSIELTEELPYFDMGLNPVIGAWDNGGDIQREWLGFMDDVCVYNNALSEAELQELATPPPSTGVGEWTLY